jgi:hypothetical protein
VAVSWGVTSGEIDRAARGKEQAENKEQAGMVDAAMTAKGILPGTFKAI